MQSFFNILIIVRLLLYTALIGGATRVYNVRLTWRALSASL